MEPPRKKQKHSHSHAPAINKRKRADQPLSKLEQLLAKIPATYPKTCRDEMSKFKNHEDYWSGRTTPADQYDFLIISGMPDAIHRYIK
jgi:hypothetical protein